MSDLILMIGIPGSGKSTLAATWQQQQAGVMLISTDAIRQQLFGDEAIQGPWLLVWREVQRQFRAAVQQISQGEIQVAVYDATNAVRRQRREAIALARSTGFTHITAFWLDTPLTLCLERNRQRDRQVPDDVIYRMNRCLMGAPPSLDEDLNHIIHYISFSTLFSTPEVMASSCRSLPVRLLTTRSTEIPPPAS
jgi:predicted kinase